MFLRDLWQILLKRWRNSSDRGIWGKTVWIIFFSNSWIKSIRITCRLDTYPRITFASIGMARSSIKLVVHLRNRPLRPSLLQDNLTLSELPRWPCRHCLHSLSPSAEGSERSLTKRFRSPMLHFRKFMKIISNVRILSVNRGLVSSSNYQEPIIYPKSTCIYPEEIFHQILNGQGMGNLYGFQCQWQI